MDIDDFALAEALDSVADQIDQPDFDQALSQALDDRADDILIESAEEAE